MTKETSHFDAFIVVVPFPQPGRLAFWHGEL
jgi:hypothetical protein